MKILLINPPESMQEERQVFFRFYKSLWRARVLPPLGLAYIAALLRENRIEDVSILDANALQMDSYQIKKYIEDKSPDLVGVTTVTQIFRRALLICRIVKQINSKIVTVIGGPHMMLFPKETVSFDEIDIGLVGEAEFTMQNLINKIENDQDWSDIPGIVYQLNDKIHFSSPGDRVKNLDKLPFPARDLLPNSEYYDVTSKHYNAMSMITARGCPYNCLFCNRDIRGYYRARSPEKVVDEMEEIVKKYGFKEIVIYDDTFTVNKKRVIKICEEIIRRNLKFSWDCRTRVDCVSPSLLKLMKKAGCHRISYGVESANERILKILRKDITPEQSRKAIEWTKDAGIMVLAYFMIGTPTETKKEVTNTINFSKELEPDFGYYSITVPYPETGDLYDISIKAGYTPSGYWEKFVRGGGILPAKMPYFESEEISREYLDRTIKKAYREFYFRPKYIRGRLKYIRSVGDLRWHIKIAKSLIM